jgi:CMP-N-acetylneuraminic acid synthetase
MFDSPAQGLLIDDWRVQDIDDEEDWLNAELLWRLNESK